MRVVLGAGLVQQRAFVGAVAARVGDRGAGDREDRMLRGRGAYMNLGVLVGIRRYAPP